MFLVSLQTPTIEAPTLELFAQRTDGWRQERFDFGLGLTRPAQRPKQCACSQVSSGKAVPDQKLPSFERLVEPLKRQQEALFRPTRGSALMFIIFVIARRIVAKENANSERCSQGASWHRNLKAGTGGFGGELSRGTQ